MHFSYRKKRTKAPGKSEVKTGATPYYSTIVPPTSNPVTPYYSSVTSPGYASTHDQYNRLQHDKPTTIAPIQKPTSDNCLPLYEKVYPKNEDNRLSNEYAS